MTTAKTNRAPTLEHDHIVFPDPPKGTPEDMTASTTWPPPAASIT